MPEFVPRFLIVVTGIVAVLAVIIGIRDYVQRPIDATHSSSVDVPVASHPGDTPARKKHSARKAKRADLSQADLPQEDLSAGSNLAANSGEGLTIEGDSFTTGSMDGSVKIARVQPAVDRSDLRFVTRTCVPLPNSTKPEDVDAPYYQKWAREYGCNADELARNDLF